MVFWFYWFLCQIEKYFDVVCEIVCDVEVFELLGGGVCKFYVVVLIMMMWGGFVIVFVFGLKDRRYCEMWIKLIFLVNEGKCLFKLVFISVLLMSWLLVVCVQVMVIECVVNDWEIYFVFYDDQVMYEVYEEIQICQVEGEDGEICYEIMVEGSGMLEECEVCCLELFEQLENGEDGVVVFVIDVCIVGYVVLEIVECLIGEDGVCVVVCVYENIVLYEVDGVEFDVNVFVCCIEVFDGVEMIEDVLCLESVGGYVVCLGDVFENVVILDVDDVDVEIVCFWMIEDGGQFEVIIVCDVEGEVYEWVSEDGCQVEVIVNGELGDVCVFEWEGEDGEIVELWVIGDIEGVCWVMCYVCVECVLEVFEELEGEFQDELNKVFVVEFK